MSTPSPSPEPSDGRVARAARSVGRGTWRDMDQGWFMAAELLSGLFIFGGLGWWIGTRIGGHPFPFIGGSLLGFFGGFYVLYLRAEGRIGPPRTPPVGTEDDQGPQPSGPDGSERP